MQFITDLRVHLKSFESQAKDEINRFLDFAETKYVEPKDAVVSKPQERAPEPSNPVQPIEPQPIEPPKPVDPPKPKPPKPKKAEE